MKHEGTVFLAFVIGAIIIGVGIGLACFQTRTSVIMGKNIEGHWGGSTYVFAMENGDVVEVNFADYTRYNVGDNFTYRNGQTSN